MRMILILAATAILAGCGGDPGERYIASANDKVLVVVSDITRTTSPDQLFAKVHYRAFDASLAGPDMPTAASVQSAFDCRQGLVRDLGSGKETPSMSGTVSNWSAPTRGTIGATIFKVVCDPAHNGVEPSPKSVRTLERHWRMLLKQRATAASSQS